MQPKLIKALVPPLLFPVNPSNPSGSYALPVLTVSLPEPFPPPLIYALDALSLCRSCHRRYHTAACTS